MSNTDTSEAYFQARDVACARAEHAFFSNYKNPSYEQRNLFIKGFEYGFSAGHRRALNPHATPTSAPPPVPTSKYDSDPEWS